MAFSSFLYFVIVPVPSICPDTICPPNLPFKAIALSRFTMSPFPTCDKLVRLTVSAITSALKPSELMDVTVRHVPFTAMLSPNLVPSRTFLAFIVIHPDAPFIAMLFTTPSSSIIPVKIFLTFFSYT